jgi:DNA invertase Pin-like site-specific DNA recombinase
MFHVVAAMAEFERALIRERVTAGIHAARARGTRIGQPRTYVNPDRIRDLRSQGVPWRQLSKQLGIGVGTAVRAIQ